MEESANFAKLEHLSSYSAAEALGSDDLDRVSYYPKKGCFVTRRQATITAVGIGLIIFIAVYLGKSSYQDGSWTNTKRLQTSQYANHRNVTEAIHNLPKLGGKISEHSRNRGPTNEDLLKYLVEPIHYNVKITSIPSFRSIVAKDLDFEGEVVIDLHSKENVDYLIIGTSELQDAKPTMVTKPQHHSRTAPDEIKIDKVYNYAGLMRLEFKQPLEPSKVYELKITYRGRIRSLPYGLFYMIDRDSETLEESFLLATNTDTPFARTIFPCFDSREQNATYQISILRDSNWHFESSIPHWKSESTSEETWDRVHLTQSMRTDQFQFTITSYKEQSAKTPDMLHFSVWTTRERKHEISYIMDIGPKLIEDLQVYFDVPLPTPKVNVFALPQLIPHLKSKMGMIYVPERDVLYTKQKNSKRHKHQIALSAAAHIAEQWIESIITFKHDEDEWLKESLVEYLKYKALSFVEPKWHLEAEFYTDVQQIEMQNDISNFIASHSLITTYIVKHYSFPVQTVHSPGKMSSINEKINQNRYQEIAAAGIYNKLHRPKLNSKGACFFRMLQHMVTEPIFRISLTLFLQKSKQEDVLGHDFWSIMSEEVENAEPMDYQLLPEGVSLNSVLKTWLENDGYPTLSVSRDYDKATITFTQIHFTDDDKNKELEYWYIPISYTTQKEEYFLATAPRLWLGKVPEKTIDQPKSLHNDEWLLVNPQHTGFYRVNYDEKNWRMLKKSIQNGEFPAIIQSQLLDDALYFGRKGMLDYGFVLSLTLHLGEFVVTDHTIWKPVLRHLQYVQNLLIHAEENSGSEYETTIFGSFKNYVRWMITAVYQHLTEKIGSKTDEPSENNSLQSDIFLWACAVNIEDCKEKMERSFDSWKTFADPDENNPIEPDIRYAVLCSAMRYGQREDFNFLFDRYLNTLGINPDKEIYLKSLFCYPEENELKKLLNITLSPGYSEVLLKQIQQIWSASGDSFYATEVPFQFLMKNWDEIEKKYAEFHIIITEMVRNSTKNIYTILSHDTLEKFADEHGKQLNYLEKVLLTAKRAVADRIMWKMTRLDELGRWLKLNSPQYRSEVQR